MVGGVVVVMVGRDAGVGGGCSTTTLPPPPEIFRFRSYARRRSNAVQPQIDNHLAVDVVRVAQHVVDDPHAACLGPERNRGGVTRSRSCVSFSSLTTASRES
jgi:hypothetical protein